MRKLTVIVTLVLFCWGFQAAHAEETGLDQTTRLAGLAQVWGFLKYYHSNIAQNKLDWDQVLLETIPKVKQAESFSAFNQEIARLLERAGNFTPLQSRKPPDYNGSINDPLFSWISNTSIFDWYNSWQLTQLKNNFIQIPNYYVGTSIAGNATFDNEKQYPAVYPNENVRLLALFRFWNIINYFYPYKESIGEDWNKVLAEFIPRTIAAANELEYHLLMKELTVRIRDGQALFSSPAFSNYIGTRYAPLETRTPEDIPFPVVSRIYPELLNNGEDIRVGDIITTVDGKIIPLIKQEINKYIAASNDPGREKGFNAYLLMGNTASVQIIRQRGDEVKIVSLKRYTLPEIKPIWDALKNRLHWKTLPGNIGYVDMELLTTAEVASAMIELQNMRGIIFDLRNTPNETWSLIAQRLNPRGTEFARFTKPFLTSPGSFFWTESLKAGPDSENNNYYKGKVVILCDETTQGPAEYACMALQTAPKAFVIGSQTAGADGNVSKVNLPGGIIAQFSGIGVFYPDKRSTQRSGIVLNQNVKPTLGGIANGIDEVLAAAAAWINQ